MHAAHLGTLSAQNTVELAPRQRWQLSWLLLLWAAFIIYGSWVPLNFQPSDPAEIWNTLWQWSAWDSLREQRIDTAVNVLLTVPLGFGLALLWINSQARTHVLAGIFVRVAIVLLVLALSVLAEYGQGFIPGRSESLGDVLAQTAGTIFGLILHARFGNQARVWLIKVGTAVDTQSRVTHSLHGYLVALLLFAVMPLDLTLDIGELYHKWQDGRVILLPFSDMRGTTPEIIYELVTDVLLWVPVGALWRLNEPLRTPGAIALRAALLALAIECIQLLVLSRLSDTTDVILAIVGAFLGALIVPYLQQVAASGQDALQRIWKIGLLVWLAVVVMIYSFPFDMQWPQQGWLALEEAFTRVPFITYFRRHEFGALNEILRKLLVFLPGGLLIRLWLTSAAKTPSRVALVWLALLAFLLEAGQVLLPERVAELTDALLATLGAILGWRLAGWLTKVNYTLPAEAATVVNDMSLHAQRNNQSTYRTGSSSWWWHGVSIAGLMAALWLFARVPDVPYNVIKLMPMSPAGLMAALGLALVIWWIAVLPVAFISMSQVMAMALPLWLLLHGIITFAVLRTTVALPMLHKVIGSPILAWPSFAEDLVRYLALHSALLLPLCGGAALVKAVRKTTALAGLLYWFFLVALVAWPLHWVIVEQAATDNLTELMRDNGSFGASSWLALSIMAIGITAGALASLLFEHRHWRGLLIWIGVSAAITPVALLMGLESTIVKYDQVFSAPQFILSSSREAYADGPELALRYSLAWLAAVGTLTWLQIPWWRRAT
ncbi:hypothetical protein Nstercoris_00209 [Nitrosomonas stercoris]|uniref:VanZ-like domain-containing protein n=1 Tax=Nitrosomonas stercoris TaxID=1444684 RepID=A0A4Y1YLT4_9PROT|nr:hypothetical protein Nstercoris_00209 [Nitrosomonas stercoris]